MNKSTNTLLTLASLVIIIAGVKTASSIVIPFLLAIFIAFISAPLLLWFEKKLHFPKALSFLSVSLLVIGVLVAFGMIITNSLDGFLDSIPLFQDKLTTVLANATQSLKGFGIDIDTNKIPQMLNPTQIISNAGLFLKSTSKILSNSFLIFLLVAFMLFETHSLSAKLSALSPKNPKNLIAVETFAKNLNQYLVIKSLSSFATGAIIAIVLSIMDIKYALVWGVVAFLLNFIPTIGSILAALPAILISLIEYNLATAFWVMVVFVATNVIIGNFIEPRFMGKGLGLSTLVVFLSLLFWGWILGVAGMFLAVPLTMSLKIALQSNENTKWISLLLSNYTK